MISYQKPTYSFTGKSLDAMDFAYSEPIYQKPTYSFTGKSLDAMDFAYSEPFYHKPKISSKKQSNAATKQSSSVFLSFQSTSKAAAMSSSSNSTFTTATSNVTTNKSKESLIFDFFKICMDAMKEKHEGLSCQEYADLKEIMDKLEKHGVDFNLLESHVMFGNRLYGKIWKYEKEVF
jgi:hypothetical protein